MARYLPLRGDRVYVYETEVEGTEERGQLVLQVRQHGDVTTLGVGGRKQRVQLLSGGIHNLSGGWVLKAPLVPGARWKGPVGEVRVSRVDVIVEVPAGKFAECVETVEEGFAPGESRRITTTYCPDVGIVVLVVEGQVGTEYGHETARLKSFGPRVDLDAVPPPPP